MVKHGIDIIIGSINFLNPGQVSILACDCPIFAQAKLIQWRWPEYYSLDKLIIMFGGIHIEKALWNTLGDLLNGSGWVQALAEAGTALPLDQNHEQENAIVKGDGGNIGLTENPPALQKWAVIGPEKSTLLVMSEETFMEVVQPDYKHHEEGAASQTELCRETCALIEYFEEFGNPFLETGSELIIQNLRVCGFKYPNVRIIRHISIFSFQRRCLCKTNTEN